MIKTFEVAINYCTCSVAFSTRLIVGWAICGPFLRWVGDYPKPGVKQRGELTKPGGKGEPTTVNDLSTNSIWSCHPIYIHSWKIPTHIYSPLNNSNPYIYSPFQNVKPYIFSLKNTDQYILTFKQFQPTYIFTFPKWWWQCSIQAMFNISAHIHILPKIGQMFAHFCKFSNVCNVFNLENLAVAVSPLWKRGSSPQSCSVTMPLILSNCLTLA